MYRLDAWQVAVTNFDHASSLAGYVGVGNRRGLLAARALGLGAAMTTFQMANEQAIKDRFGVPENVSIGATIPVGYPKGRFGPVTRKPVEEVIHWNGWSS